MRLSIRVQPGSSRPSVGGRWGDAEPAVLMVRVRERAVDGRANDAVVAALAESFRVPRRSVEILSGPTSRTKSVAVTGEEDALALRLAELLERGPS